MKKRIIIIELICNPYTEDPSPIIEEAKQIFDFPYYEEFEFSEECNAIHDSWLWTLTDRVAYNYNLEDAIKEARQQVNYLHHKHNNAKIGITIQLEN